jgi:hypothetical protein
MGNTRRSQIKVYELVEKFEGEQSSIVHDARSGRRDLRLTGISMLTCRAAEGSTLVKMYLK